MQSLSGQSSVSLTCQVLRGLPTSQTFSQRGSLKVPMDEASLFKLFSQFVRSQLPEGVASDPAASGSRLATDQEIYREHPIEKEPLDGKYLKVIKKHTSASCMNTAVYIYDV